jgi:hypothetical protein
MAEIKIPEEFLNLLEDLNLPLEDAVKLIKWASANPDKIEKFMKLSGDLNGIGRRRLKYHIFRSNPIEELEEILKEQRESSETTSIYMKILHAAKKDGYSFITKPGVKGFLKKECDEFHFTFDVQGVKVEFISDSITPNGLRSIIEAGDFGTEFGDLLLEGVNIPLYDPRGKLVLEAIKRNISPYIVLAIG